MTRPVPMPRWLLTLAMLFAAVLPAAAQTADEVTVEAVQYGIGDAARAGDWAGIQVNVLDSAPEQRDILLRVAVRDADGDRANYDRVVTSNPGVEQSFWLYARMPFGSEGDPPPVLVFEAIETDEGRVRAGRLLGRYDPRIGSTKQIIEPSLGIIAVVGPYGAGLDLYNYRVGNISAVPFGHELTRVVTGMTIPLLPDHWQGLTAVDALVWTESATSNTEPSALTPERARAIRTWVERGGHLIVVLPPAGDPWFGAAHPLSDLLPEIQRPRRLDGVDLETLRPLLAESTETPLPRNAVIQSFVPAPGAAPDEARPVLTTPGGDCIVIQRLVGSGAVTVVGLDLAAGPLRRFNLPDAEAFWHRVLGRRADIKRPEEFTQQERSDATSRTQVDFDHDISSQIDSTGRAVQGILYGLVVFITYWLVAGPIGFMLLKKRNLQHHAWVGFVGCTAVFTALAWAGATALRPGRVEVTHLTLLESVHGQTASRARMWASVMLPDYGESTLSVEPSDTTPDRSPDLLAPWNPPGVSGLVSGFPDNTGYSINARSPGTLTVPTRATVKQVRADFGGQTGWAGITLQRDPARADDPAITIDGLALSGTIIHDLPGALQDVRVIVCQGQVPLRSPGAAMTGLSPTRTLVFASRFQDGRWQPGEPFDLSTVVNAASIQDALRGDYFRGAVRDGINASSINPTAGRPLTDRLVAARFISMFAPPNYNDDRDMVANRQARRFSTHGWDLGRWLTTPCVIVTGFMQVDARDASPDAIPFPLYVNDRAAPAHGLTMVTWIYPLPPSPPDWPAAPASREEAPSSDQTPDAP